MAQPPHTGGIRGIVPGFLDGWNYPQATGTAPSLSEASLVARLPDTLPAFRVRGVPHGLVTRGKPPGHARAFGHPVPHSGYGTRRQVALPSSRVPPVKTCPARRVEIRRAQP